MSFPDILNLEVIQAMNRFSDRSIEEIVRATVDLAKVKTGALIVIGKRAGFD